MSYDFGKKKIGAGEKQERNGGMYSKTLKTSFHPGRQMEKTDHLWFFGIRIPEMFSD